jgi:hypothetical protein
MERQYLKIRINDRIKNEKIRKMTKLVDVRRKIKELKWNWAGHFQRHTNEKRWPKLIENYKPINGKRRRGAPRTRWIDEILEFRGGSSWKRKALNRNLWKNMGEDFVQI